MSDVLIRDLPDEVLMALDGLAARLGLSRSEYIRRRLAQDARTARVAVSGDDLRRFAETFSDLGDSDIMARAWDE
jgi:hypothetical protein